MPRYHFKQQSLVDTISFFESESGTSRAYLHARDGVDDNQLAGILILLRSHDYDCVPYDLDGKPVLEVRNYGRPNKLLNVLKKEHIIAGEPAIERLDSDNISFKDKLSKRTLQTSGLLQFAADMMFLRYNKLEGHKEGDWASYFYTLGTLAILGYGKNDQSEFQVHELAQAFEHVLEKKGVSIPDQCSLHSIAHEEEKNPLQKIHELLRRYPSETYNLFTGLAGAMVTANAYRNHYAKVYPAHYSAESIAQHRREGLQDMGLGLTTFFACAYGLLVKEKKVDEDEPQPTNPIGKAIQYVRHNPLSVTGAGLMVSSLFHIASTTTAYKEALRTNDLKRKQSVPWRGGFVLVNFLAEILIMVSSKGHGEGVTSDDTVSKTAYKMAAEVILNQPEEQREYMTNYIADFLQAPDVLAEKHEVVVGKLKQEIEAIKDNPWLCKTGKARRSDEQAHGEHVLMTKSNDLDKPVNDWSKRATRSSAPDGAGIQPSIS